MLILIVSSYILSSHYERTVQSEVYKRRVSFSF